MLAVDKFKQVYGVLSTFASAHVFLASHGCTKVEPLSRLSEISWENCEYYSRILKDQILTVVARSVQKQ